MRALRATGWLNFRMRAMLQAVASYQLWLDWRDTGPVLARAFTDYEPGIHWSQVQMQSGTTGINTIRMYNPVKQGLDQDPDGDFTRRWVPELRAVPGALIHEPWRLAPIERADRGCVLGRDYPAPVVDLAAAAERARERVWAVRRQPGYREIAEGIQARHGSRRSGLVPITPRRATRTTATPGRQLDLGL
jgi:deoxyribodipyrimidine photo-lyase